MTSFFTVILEAECYCSEYEKTPNFVAVRWKNKVDQFPNAPRVSTSHASLYIHIKLIENRSQRIQCSRLFIKVLNLYSSTKVWINGCQIKILKWSQCTSLMLKLFSVRSHLLTKTMLYNKDCKALNVFWVFSRENHHHVRILLRKESAIFRFPTEI